MRRIVIPAFGLIAAALARPAFAQCPDGTPPPCRVAAAPVRRAAPPLDERTWIVLPFENVTRSPDVDWLREASVNLLYLDLSRWRDIRVIDDERVADYMREVPEARGGAAIGLAAGMVVARRAGAGKLVMGDLLKVGSRTRVVAKVFDVRSGQRVRSVQQDAANPDSLMPVFERLARGILNVEPPVGSAGATIGTNSLGAYQEYVAGVRALSSWDLAGAREHLERALQLDTAFALAHYKLSVVWGWQASGAPQRMAHAEAANRFAAALPARERALIAGQLAQSHGRWGEACDAYASLLRADSSDVEAWYNLGECSYHDPAVIAPGGDSAHLEFRGNWNTALRAFRRTLLLDPTYHLAFAHIPDILQADQRVGCVIPEGQGDCAATTYIAFVIRRGDSLATPPASIRDPGTQAAQAAEAARSGTKRANLLLARDLAAEWVAAGPTEPRAHRAYARALLRTGDLAGAEREAGQGALRNPTRVERIQFSQDQMEIALKLGNYQAAHAVFDSAVALVDSMGDPQARLQGALAGVMFGRFALLDSALVAMVPAPARSYLGGTIRLIAGVPPAGYDSTIRAFASIAGQIQPGVHPRDIYQAVAMWGVRWMRAWQGIPSLDTASSDARTRLAAYLLAGDTAAARRTLIRLDSSLATMAAETPEGGLFLVAAEAHLALGDSVAAYDRMLAFEPRWQYSQTFERLTASLAFGCFLWPREFLLLGDLAAAQGHPDVAVRAYRRVVGMWQGGDDAVQPSVARARAALTRLGG